MFFFFFFLLFLFSEKEKVEININHFRPHILFTHHFKHASLNLSLKSIEGHDVEFFLIFLQLYSANVKSNINN